MRVWYMCTYMRGIGGAIHERSSLHSNTKRCLQTSNDMRELRVNTIDQLHVYAEKYRITTLAMRYTLDRL